jgi:hypothetical protein
MVWTVANCPGHVIQGWRLRHRVRRAEGAPLTVIFARRKNAWREEGGPAGFCRRGCALRREPSACGERGKLPAAAPRPVGSRV